MTNGTGARPKFYEIVERVAGKRMAARDVDLLASVVAVGAYRDGLLTEADIERILHAFQQAMEGPHGKATTPGASAGCVHSGRSGGTRQDEAAAGAASGDGDGERLRHGAAPARP
jgi:hypothetical protein